MLGTAAALGAVRSWQHPPSQRALRVSVRPGVRAPRPVEAYGWLQAACPVPGVYVPQVGDAVAYLQQGHALYLANIHDHKTTRPWEQVLGIAGVLLLLVVSLDIITVLSSVNHPLSWSPKYRAAHHPYHSCSCAPRNQQRSFRPSMSLPHTTLLAPPTHACCCACCTPLLMGSLNSGWSCLRLLQGTLSLWCWHSVSSRRWAPHLMWASGARCSWWRLLGCCWACR